MCGSSADFSFMSARASQVSSCSTANPCHPTTGDKTRTETDFMFAGKPFPGTTTHSLNSTIATILLRLAGRIATATIWSQPTRTLPS